MYNSDTVFVYLDDKLIGIVVIDFDTDRWPFQINDDQADVTFAYIPY